MKTYTIPLLWTMYGHCHVEAESLEEAIEIALGPETPLPEGSYIDGSVVVDEEVLSINAERSELTKAELRTRLLNGAVLNDLLTFGPGQDCEIFKADSFVPGDTIIYIPDVALNQVPTTHPITDPEAIEEVLAQCFMGQDFLDECGGDAEKAERLFRYCDWQHPSAAVNELDDEPAKTKFTVTIEEHIGQEFTVYANDITEAMELAKDKYARGEFVLAPGNLTARLMMAVDDTTGQETEWREF